MNSLYFKNLKSVKSPVSEWTYIDLHLDIEKSTITNNTDIRMSFDEEAIKNSLINIFQTIPGERILIPNFGTNLLGYLFLPVSKFVADEIGNTILNSIKIWEPRVQVEKIDVVGIPDDHTYEITIIISIPVLKKKDVKLIGILSKEGFREVNYVW